MSSDRELARLRTGTAWLVAGSVVAVIALATWAIVSGLGGSPAGVIAGSSGSAAVAAAFSAGLAAITTRRKQLLAEGDSAR